MKNKKMISSVTLFALLASGCFMLPSNSGNSVNSESSKVSTSSSSENSSSESTPISSVSISNKQSLQSTWYVGDNDRRIDIALVASGITLDQALTEGLLKITSSDTSVVKVNGKNIRAAKVGSATITVKATDDIQDSVTITVSEKEVSAPVITITPDASIVYDTIAGNSVELPPMTCVDSYGTDLSSYVKVKSDLDPFATCTPELFLSDVEGEHTLTYSVAHPDDKTKTATATFKLNVYRKLIKSGYKWSVENELAPNDEQVIVTSDEGFGTLQLNYNASNNYYIETEIVMPTNHHGGHHVGISHYNVYNQNQFLLFDLDLGDYNWKIKNFLSDGQWNTEGEVDNWRLGEYYGHSISKLDSKVKLAVARQGAFFYFFVNDNYVTSTTDVDYSYESSFPGFFAHNGAAGTKFTKINYISGSEEVQTKINSLTNNGSDMICSYIARGFDWAFESKNTNNRRFTVNEYSEERGVNFDFTDEHTHHNSGMVSLYQYLDGNFKFEWEYKPTSVSTPTSNDCKMWLEARPFDYSSPLFWFGTKFRDSDAEQMMKYDQVLDTNNNPVSDTFNTSVWDSKTITNPREGAKYEVTRTVGDNSSTFTLRVTSLADPTQVVERTFEYSGKCWNDKLILIWHNTSLAGQYSNIKYSV